MKTFLGGVILEGHKELTEHKPIRKLALPRRVIIPLLQHDGVMCEPLVSVGDTVCIGQKIGESQQPISAPVHATIVGKVTAIDKSIVIENPEGLEEDWGKCSSAAQLTHMHMSGEGIPREEVLQMVKEAGIVGLGGEAFPTHVKLNPPVDKPIEYLIINGCECEPYTTAGHRIMLERTKEMIEGAEIARKVCKAKKIIFAIESNKRNVIEKLGYMELPDHVLVESLAAKYPQGAEEMLIKALLGREVPSQGFPMDIGCVVINVGTAVAIREAVNDGRPLISRVITVSGSGVKEPQNVVVRIGMPISEVLAQCGGLTDDAAKIIMGGPMMGLAQINLETPVIKGTSCILVLSKKEVVEEQVLPCVKCGKCVDSCPMQLVPTRLYQYAENNSLESFDEWGGIDCIECGCCAYICPARVPLVEGIKLGKEKLRTAKNEL